MKRILVLIVFVLLVMSSVTGCINTSKQPSNSNNENETQNNNNDNTSDNKTNIEDFSIVGKWKFNYSNAELNLDDFEPSEIIIAMSKKFGSKAYEGAYKSLLSYIIYNFKDDGTVTFLSDPDYYRKSLKELIDVLYDDIASIDEKELLNIFDAHSSYQIDEYYEILANAYEQFADDYTGTWADYWKQAKISAFDYVDETYSNEFFLAGGGQLNEKGMIEETSSPSEYYSFKENKIVFIQGGEEIETITFKIVDADNIEILNVESPLIDTPNFKGVLLIRE